MSWLHAICVVVTCSPSPHHFIPSAYLSIPFSLVITLLALGYIFANHLNHFLCLTCFTFTPISKKGSSEFPTEFINAI